MLNDEVAVSRSNHVVDVQLMILQYTERGASFAGCSNCEQKFFVPHELMRDRNLSLQYLRDKFDYHACPSRPRDRMILRRRTRPKPAPSESEPPA